MRKIIYVLVRWAGNFVQVLRRIRIHLFTRCWVRNVLGRVHIDTGCMHVELGSNATLYPHTILETAA